MSSAKPFRELDAERGLDEPRAERLDPQHPQFSAIMAAHRAALDSRQGTYLDPVTGFIVMTAQSHVERGFCCENGCRHCPYRPH